MLLLNSSCPLFSILTNSAVLVTAPPFQIFAQHVRISSLSRDRVSASMALSGVIPGITPDWMTSEHMTGVNALCEMYL